MSESTTETIVELFLRTPRPDDDVVCAQRDDRLHVSAMVEFSRSAPPA
jgi:hypothetical protein